MLIYHHIHMVVRWFSKMHNALLCLSSCSALCSPLFPMHPHPPPPLFPSFLRCTPPAPASPINQPMIGQRSALSGAAQARSVSQPRTKKERLRPPASNVPFRCQVRRRNTQHFFDILVHPDKKSSCSHRLSILSARHPRCLSFAHMSSD